MVRAKLCRGSAIITCDQTKTQTVGSESARSRRAFGWRDTHHTRACTTLRACSHRVLNHDFWGFTRYPDMSFLNDAAKLICDVRNT